MKDVIRYKNVIYRCRCGYKTGFQKNMIEHKYYCDKIFEREEVERKDDI